MYKAIINEHSLSVSGDDFRTINNEALSFDIIETGKGGFHVLLNNRSYRAEVISVDKEAKTCEIRVGNSVVNVAVLDRYDELLRAIGLDEAGGRKVNDIKAPMPGMVLNVMVKDGEPVRKGDAIFVLEAMKMENILKSPADGVIKKIRVSKGDKVEKNQVMLDLA